MTTFNGTEAALRTMIAEVIAQIRNPITCNHRAEVEALTAEVMYYWERLRDIREDWTCA